MKVDQATFFRSAQKERDFPSDGFPQIAFAGRSNVGKSSMINTLLKRKNLARISSQPGKTRSINFLLINRKFYFVDLPGYGFARVSKQERQRWKILIEGYLVNNNVLRGLVHIVDARIGLTDTDEEMVRFAQQIEIPTLLAATKWDKLKKSEQEKQKGKISDQISNYGLSGFVPFSAKTSVGRIEIWNWIDEQLRRS